MELRPHQTKALDNVNEIFEESNKAIVVQPTGVGKTYIALGLFEQNKDKKLMFVAPSTAILWQLKLKIAKEYSVGPEEYKKVFPNLELTTYQQMNADRKKSKTYVKKFKADYVVYDEAHHIADNKWGKNARDIMSAHSETKFLGLTATPERTDGIDVVKEVFDGNLADEITLEEAVATRLLKMPDYINAIYSYKPIIENLEERIEALEEIAPDKYVMLKKDMEKAKNALEKADGMPEIFAKHIQEKDGRFIVFCKDIEHLKQMVQTSKTEGWFDGVNKNIETLEIHSEEDDETNRKVLKRFKGDFEATDNTLRVLFSVAKINEGIHLDNLSGVIMLRPTKSKIIFRQQLGRTMSISEDAKHTTAFDIVNNIDSFQDMHDFMEQVIQIRIKNNPDIDPEEIRKEAIEEFNITAETREVGEILEKIAGGLEAEWETNYKRSVKWREEHDGKGPRGSIKSKEEQRVYQWERRQILKYLRGHKNCEEQEVPKEYREKIKKLKELGLEYIPIIYRTPEEHFDVWKKWTLEHDITPLQTSKDEEEKRIAVNMSDAVRRMKRKPEEYKEILEEHSGIYSQYGDKAVINFKRWKKWTLEHGITPLQTSEDEEEKRIAEKMAGILGKIKRKPEEYKEILEEHSGIYSQYGREKHNKTMEEHFELWKGWTQEHGVTPSQASKDKEEKIIAQNMSDAVRRMKRKPEEYKEILEEHSGIYSQYGREKHNKTMEEHFELWKGWTQEHGCTPAKKSQDEEEKRIAVNMAGVLGKIKRKPEEYKEILEEYAELYVQYGRKKLKSLQQEKEQELSDVKALKTQTEQAETLDKETREAVKKELGEKSQNPEEPGE